MCPTLFRYAKINIYNFLVNSDHILVQITFNVNKRLQQISLSLIFQTVYLNVAKCWWSSKNCFLYSSEHLHNKRKNYNQLVPWLLRILIFLTSSLPIYKINISPCVHSCTFTDTLNCWWAFFAKRLVEINITSSCSQNVNKKKDFPFSICLLLVSVSAEQWNCRTRGKWPAQNAVAKGFKCAVTYGFICMGAQKWTQKKFFHYFFSEYSA